MSLNRPIQLQEVVSNIISNYIQQTIKNNLSLNKVKLLYVQIVSNNRYILFALKCLYYNHQESFIAVDKYMH